MRKLYIYILVFGLLFLTEKAEAQEAHFSQNYALSMHINPAMTGIISGKLRASAIYRNQWYGIGRNDAFRTAGAMVDARLKGLRKHDGVGVGLYFFSDKAGQLDLSTNHLSAAGSYNLALNNAGNHFITVGAQAAFVNQSIDLSLARFGDQYNDGTFVDAPDGGEILEDNSINYFQTSAGLMYYYVRDRRKFLYVGAAAYQLNGADVGFSGLVKEKKPMRISAQFGASTPIGSSIDLNPSMFFIMEKLSMKADIGTYVRFILDSNRYQVSSKAFSVGTWIRYARPLDGVFGLEALILAARLEYEVVTFGISYDVTLSKLQSGLNLGAFEVFGTFELEDNSRYNRHVPTDSPRF